MAKLTLGQLADGYAKYAALSLFPGRADAARAATEEAGGFGSTVRRIGRGALEAGKALGKRGLLAGVAAAAGVGAGTLIDEIATSGRLRRSKKQVAELFPGVRDQLDKGPVGFDRAFDSIARTAPDIAADPIGAAMALRSVHQDLGMDPRSFKDLAEAQKVLAALQGRGKMREGFFGGLGKGLGESVLRGGD